MIGSFLPRLQALLQQTQMQAAQAAHAQQMAQGMQHPPGGIPTAPPGAQPPPMPHPAMPQGAPMGAAPPMGIPR